MTKISELTAGTTLIGSEVIAAVQNGQTVRLTLSQISGGLPPLDVVDGDSLSYNGAGGLGLWPTYLAANHAYFGRGTFVNFAVPGDTTTQMAARYAAGVGAVSAALYGEKRSHFWGGSNDTVTVGPTAASIYAAQKIRWAADRAKGFKVVAYTLMQRGDTVPTSTQNDMIRAVNVLIRSDRSLYDWLVEPDLYFTNNADTTIFAAGGVHLTTAANVILAQKANEVILGSDQNSWIPYLPVVTPDSGAFSSMTPTGKFSINGKTISFRIRVVIGASGIGTATGGFLVTVPFTLVVDEPFVCAETAVIALPFYARGNAGTNGIYVLSNTGGASVGNGRVIILSGTCERA